METSALELQPSTPEAEAVCELVREYLRNRQPAFADRLGFLNRGDFSLDWSAAAGGVALFTILETTQPASMGLLLCGIEQQTEAEMVDAFTANVLPIAGGDLCPDRPLLLHAVFPGRPEITPILQLVASALASVFFRTVLRLHASSGAAP